MSRKSTSKTTQKRFSKPKFSITNSQQLVLGSFLVILGILLFIALLSYFFTGESDHVLIIYPILILIFTKVYKLTNWKEKLIGTVTKN